MAPGKTFRAFILNPIPGFVINNRPFRFIKGLFSKKNLTGIVAEIYNPDQTDELKAFSAAFGIFMGIIPIWGFQTIAAIFLAVALKLNKTLVGVFLLVSVPPIMPLIIFLSYRFGRYWMGNKVEYESVSRHLQQYIYGSLSLAIVAAITTGLLAFVLLKLIRAIKQYKLTTT
ncbi:MAG: DUF2062 domain-containing protein [Sphingobacteriales bacterium]